MNCEMLICATLD